MDNLSNFLSDCCHMHIFMVSNSLCTLVVVNQPLVC